MKKWLPIESTENHTWLVNCLLRLPNEQIIDLLCNAHGNSESIYAHAPFVEYERDKLILHRYPNEVCLSYDPIIDIFQLKLCMLVYANTTTGLIGLTYDGKYCRLNSVPLIRQLKINTI